jgi:hypothetical protein
MDKRQTCRQTSAGAAQPGSNMENLTAEAFAGLLT